MSQAAESCFGKDAWPENIPVPQAWLEFDVDSLIKRSGTGAYAKLTQAVAKTTKDAYGRGRGTHLNVIARVVSKALKTRKPNPRYVAGKGPLLAANPFW